MPDPSDRGTGPPAGAGGKRPPYSEYQLDIYRDRLLQGKEPPATTDPERLEAAAREAMTPEGFGYVAGGASAETTVEANRLAFRSWRLVPRFLRPTLPRDLGVELFGVKYDTPIIMAPVGVQEAYHPDKETGVAAACAELGVPFTISTAASSTIEEIEEASTSAALANGGEVGSAATAGAAAGAGGPARLWFQLYWPLDDDITASLLARARRAGCRVLVVTLDTYALSWRPRDLDRGFLPFVVGQGNAVGFSDPVFRRKFAEGVKSESGDVEGGEAEDQQQEDQQAATPEDDPLTASRAWIAEAFSGHPHTWEDLALLRRLWRDAEGRVMPIVLKGVLSVEDARLALRHGMDGIVVSNHGGRQLDGAVASLEVLPEIVDAVGAEMTVLLDSGVRTGPDVMKAICLGAKGVMVGRPVIYGLGIAGRQGAKHVLASLLADLDQSMGLSGVKNVAGLTRDLVRKVSYGGSTIKASL